MLFQSVMRRGWLTSLGRAEVLARRRRARPSPTSLLDAQSPALVDLALQCFLGRICLLRRVHLDEAEATTLAGMWVLHNVALLHDAVLLEQAVDLVLTEARVNAGDEEVRSWVCRILVVVVLVWWWAAEAASVAITCKRFKTARTGCHARSSARRGSSQRRHVLALASESGHAEGSRGRLCYVCQRKFSLKCTASPAVAINGAAGRKSFRKARGSQVGVFAVRVDAPSYGRGSSAYVSMSAILDMSEQR